MNKRTKYMVHAAIIAALYIVLTIISNAAGLASGVIQVRISEALTILPAFTPAAIPGLFIGCLISNILAGGIFWDVIFGSLASLIGVIGCRALRKFPYLALVPYALANMVIIPFVVNLVYSAPEALPLIFLTVGIGEIISVFGFGIPLYLVLKKHKNVIFK